MGGNPKTDPFFVDGAMPGDTLAIKFIRIRLNRDSAGSRYKVAQVVDPQVHIVAKIGKAVLAKLK